MQDGPAGPPRSVRCVEVLRAGLAPLVDGNCGAGTSGHLHAMFLAPEVVGDIPVVGLGLAGRVLATLDVLGLRLLSTTDVGAHRASCDSTTDGGDIITASATDLVTENAANYGADDRPRNVEIASILRDLFLLDPASLLGCSDHRAH
jgi:hypothetical protein